MNVKFRFFLALSLSLSMACAGAVSRPCTDGGQAAREKPVKGHKQCSQIKNSQGLWVNDGSYVEWYPSGGRALKGSYKVGQKDGQWLEWDESGKKISEKWYVEGAEVPGRVATQPIPSPTMR